jgi:hypothetical protein
MSTSSTSSVFEQAASLNNQGVAALCEHDEETALRVLTNSIRLMKSELSKMKSGGVELSFNNGSSSSFSPSSSSCCELPMELIELPNQAALRSKQLMIFTDDEDDQALFNHAISIPSPLSSYNDHDGQLSDLDIHIYSAAVVFNLALAHHQLANKHKFDPDRFHNQDNTNTATATNNSIYNVNRNKAEKLYTVILKLLQDTACSQVRTGVIVKLAAIHNLHWIKYQKNIHTSAAAVVTISHQQDDADSLQQTLSRFVQGIRSLDPYLARTFLEHDAQIQGLLMNVLWLKDQQAPPKLAPAA